MRTLSMEMRTAETAHELWTALARFDAEVIEQAPETFIVRVDLTRGRSDIVSILNAIRRYVLDSQASPALIDLDGRTYMMEAR